MFNYLSSEIDWCEPNFLYCKYITEFFNSITSLFFIFAGFYGIIKAPQKTFFVYLIYSNLIFIGIGSFLFHSMLSLFGQLLDEYGILLYMYFSLIYLNKIYIKNPLLISISLLIFPIIFFTFPIMNRFLLFSLGFYLIKVITKNEKNFEKIDPKINYLLGYSKIYFYIGFFFWIIDFLCFLPFSSHFLWHIFIGLNGYNCALVLNIIHYERNNNYQKNFFVKDNILPIIEFK